MRELLVFFRSVKNKVCVYCTDQQYWGHLPNHEPCNQEHRNDDVGAKGSVGQGGPCDIRKQLSAGREQNQASDRNQLQDRAEMSLNITG